MVGGQVLIIYVASVLLRDEDINVTLECRESWTPLGAASSAGHLKVVKALVRRLIDQGETDALYVKHRGGSSGTPLFLASDGGHTKVVELHLRHRDPTQKQIDETNNGGRTALLAAAMSWLCFSPSMQTQRYNAPTE